MAVGTQSQESLVLGLRAPNFYLSLSFHIRKEAKPEPPWQGLLGALYGTVPGKPLVSAGCP